MSNESVWVVVRFRADDSPAKNLQSLKLDETTVSLENYKPYSYDSVIAPEADQEEAYRKTSKMIVD